MIRFVLPDLRRLENTEAEALVLFRFEEKVPFRGISSLVDWRLRGHLSRITIEDFFTGEPEVPLLMPLGRFLPQSFLLLMGLGARMSFCQEVFEQTLNRAFLVLRETAARRIALALPGRVEDACRGSDAIEWFISAFEAAPWIEESYIIEPSGVQKTMVPAVERWRLRSLVPEAQ